MSQTHYKFNKPATFLVAGVGKDNPNLELEGQFPNATVSQKYVGSINVLNAMGEFTVKKLAGELPDGATIKADNEDAKVTITWPAYSTSDAPIENPTFENNLQGWEAGPGWRATNNNPITGSISAGYVDQGGFSILSSLSRYPVLPNTAVWAKCLVRQGASSAGNAGANVRVEFRDPVTGSIIKFKDGNEVMSASNNAVYPSEVTTVSPSVPSVVNIAARGIRYKQNKEVWVDSFEWDYAVPTSGANEERSYTFTIEVTDSAGRTASGEYTIVVGEVSLAKLWVGPFSGMTPSVYEISLPGGAKTSITPANANYDHFASDGKEFVVLNGVGNTLQRLSFNGGVSFSTSNTNAGTGVVSCICKSDLYYFWSVGYATGIGQIVRKKIADNTESTIYSWNSVGPVKFNNQLYIAYKEMGNQKYGVSADQGATFTEFDTSTVDCYGLLATASQLFRVVQPASTSERKLQRYISAGNWVDVTTPSTSVWSGWASIGDRLVFLIASGASKGVYYYDSVSESLVPSDSAPFPAVPTTGPMTGGSIVATGDKFYLLAEDQKIYSSTSGSGNWFPLVTIEDMPIPVSFCLINPVPTSEVTFTDISLAGDVLEFSNDGVLKLFGIPIKPGEWASSNGPVPGIGNNYEILVTLNDDGFLSPSVSNITAGVWTDMSISPKFGFGWSGSNAVVSIRRKSDLVVVASASVTY